jgi:cell division protease FtsH
MNQKLGPLTYGRRQQLAFLGVVGQEERNFSEETARMIDAEVRALVEEGQARAHEILSTRRPALDALAAALQEQEVMDREEVERLVRERTQSPPAGSGNTQAPSLTTGNR